MVEGLLLRVSERGRGAPPPPKGFFEKLTMTVFWIHIYWSVVVTQNNGFVFV